MKDADERDVLEADVDEEKLLWNTPFLESAEESPGLGNTYSST